MRTPPQDTLIAHRLTAPADKAPVISWLKSNADKQTASEVESSMPSLPTVSTWLGGGPHFRADRIPEVLDVR